MFLCAVARPRFDDNGNFTLDGTILICPFVHTVLAKRSSKNLPAGTPVLRSLSVTREVYVDFLVYKVFLAMREKFLRTSDTIYVQHANTTPHCRADDELVKSAGLIEWCNITVIAQSPTSPDYNFLYLGFFRAIHSMQYLNASRNIRELISEKHCIRLSSMTRCY